MDEGGALEGRRARPPFASAILCNTIFPTYYASLPASFGPSLRVGRRGTRPSCFMRLCSRALLFLQTCQLPIGLGAFCALHLGQLTQVFENFFKQLPDFSITKFSKTLSKCCHAGEDELLEYWYSARCNRRKPDGGYRCWGARGARHATSVSHARGGATPGTAATVGP